MPVDDPPNNVTTANPFRPSFGTTPPRLAGRDHIVQHFADGLDEGPGAPARASLFTGQRGVGKTVMLNEVEDLARRRGWITMSESGHAGLVDRLLADHLGPALRSLDPEATTTTLTGLGGPLELGSIQWATDQQYRRMTGLRTQLARAADLCAENGTGVLVTVDEVHAADTADLRELTTVVQHCFREDRSVAFAAAGLPAAVSVRLLDDDVLTFLRRAERFELGSVGRVDALEAILVPIRAAGRDIAADALETAVTATSGYPFLIQLVGYHVWRIDPRAPTITTGHVAAAIPAVEERLGRLVLEPAVSGLSARDQDFLDAMAVDDGPSRVRDIAERLGVSGNYVNRYRRRLLDAELITEAGRGRVDLQLPGAREWLRERAAP